MDDDDDDNYCNEFVILPGREGRRRDPGAGSVVFCARYIPISPTLCTYVRTNVSSCELSPFF